MADFFRELAEGVGREGATLGLKDYFKQDKSEDKGYKRQENEWSGMMGEGVSADTDRYKSPTEIKVDNISVGYFWLLAGTLLFRLFPLEIDHPIRSLIILGIAGISIFAVYKNLLFDSFKRILVYIFMIVFYFGYIKFLFF